MINPYLLEFIDSRKFEETPARERDSTYTNASGTDGCRDLLQQQAIQTISSIKEWNNGDIIARVLYSSMSISRYSGGMNMNGKYYTYIYGLDLLVTEEALSIIQKYVNDLLPTSQ